MKRARRKTLRLFLTIWNLQTVIYFFIFFLFFFFFLKKNLHLRFPYKDPSDAEEEEDSDDIRPALPKGEKNSQLTVGYKGDRSYVLRGNDIGIFSHKPDGVEYYGSISGIATLEGKEFRPKRVRLCSWLWNAIVSLSSRTRRSCSKTKIPNWC
jgi:hypothetical protein